MGRHAIYLALSPEKVDEQVLYEENPKEERIKTHDDETLRLDYVRQFDVSALGRLLGH